MKKEDRMENTGQRIMVVDDEEHICKSVEKILKKNNFQVDFATSADEALAKMAVETYSLLISDIVMPGKNGLELLKLVKSQWPLTKAMMITAYASTDTAVKAIRLGALDYLPKPFTPSELRTKVNLVLSGDLKEAPVTEKEKESIHAIDVDMPFDQEEVAKATGEDYTKRLGRGDMPVVEVKISQPIAGFCDMGDMVCDIFKKLGMTCKAGVKSAVCPQKKAKKTKGASKDKGFDAKVLIGIDQPFNYDEVVSVTGPEYIRNLHNGYSFVPYEELKANMAKTMESRSMDVDIPFDRDEVAKSTGEDYTKMLGRGDMPVVEVKASQPIAGFCDMGDMVCDIFKKLGATCKAGVKTKACPQKKAKKGKSAAKGSGFDAKRMIGPEFPFDYEEVVAATGPSFARNLVHEGLVVTPYEELKNNYSLMMEQEAARTSQAGILVIDDEVGVNNNIRKILEKKDFIVDQAFTKSEALEKIHSGFYKLVLLDLRIPGVKGLELLEAIRRSLPETRVVIVTGYASIETAVETARLGAVDYLAKPFTPDEIRLVTENAFQLAA
ncbi:MAG: response regulator [Desulfobacteraceae bacterium]|nr:response regulator [Desulfobacteraceae bacterium]